MDNVYSNERNQHCSARPSTLATNQKKIIIVKQPLLEVGNGLKDMGEDLVKMPNECIVKGDLIEDMYKDVKSNEDLKEICCLSPKNVFVDEMNKEILEKKVLGKKVTKFRYEKSFTY